MNYIWTIFCVIPVFIGGCHGDGLWPTGWINSEKCESGINNVAAEDAGTVADESDSRLYFTWLSEDCEARVGPEYILRKYTFYENGTFNLVRYYYAEESCSVPTHTVTARGTIQLLSKSRYVTGATETRYELEHVRIVPITRMVARKLSHRVMSCHPRSRWREYQSHVIYEQSPQSQSNAVWVNPGVNGFLLESGKHQEIDCLQALSIDYDELKLMRVQWKHSPPTAFGQRIPGQPRVELLLASLPANLYVRATHHSTSLQPTVLLRSTTPSYGCLVCGAVSRATECNPPLLHVVVSLPAFIGGAWISSSCESWENGLWVKRQIQFYSGDMLWTARKDYYADPVCSKFLYAVMSAGSYVQHATRQTRFSGHNFLTRDKPQSHTESVPSSRPDDSDYLRTRRHVDGGNDELLAQYMTTDLAGKLLDVKRDARHSLPPIKPVKQTIETPVADLDLDYAASDSKSRRSLLLDDSYKHLFDDSQGSMAKSFTAMLRGNSGSDSLPKPSGIPPGIISLDLHVAESVLIIEDKSIATRCGAQINRDRPDGAKARPMNSWPDYCVKHARMAPHTENLRARLGISWTGEYTMQLASRGDHIWLPPLQNCGPTPSRNYYLRQHLRPSLIGSRYSLSDPNASASLVPGVLCLVFGQIIFYLL